MRRSPNSLRRGFTLIELMLVMALLPILSFAMYSNFNSGFAIWKAGNREIPEEAPSLFYRRAGTDLQNLRRYSPVPFEGSSAEIAFCAGVPSPAQLGGERGIGRVRYYYDDNKKAVLREEQNFSELYKERPGRVSLAMEGVESFSIEYFFQNPQDKTSGWISEWAGRKEGELPLAVRFVFESAPFGQRRTDTRTFPVAVGGGGK